MQCQRSHERTSYVIANVGSNRNLINNFNMYKSIHLSSGCNIVQSVENQPTFRRNRSPSSSELKSKPSKNHHEANSKQSPAFCFMQVSCLDYSLTLKVEATCSSETSVIIQRTAWRYVPEFELFITITVRKLKSFTYLFLFCVFLTLNVLFYVLFGVYIFIQGDTSQIGGRPHRS
jgi:hypothetical protein